MLNEKRVEVNHLFIYLINEKNVILIKLRIYNVFIIKTCPLMS